jgi:hypothetical protein
MFAALNPSQHRQRGIMWIPSEITFIDIRRCWRHEATSRPQNPVVTAW